MPRSVFGTRVACLGYLGWLALGILALAGCGERDAGRTSPPAGTPGPAVRAPEPAPSEAAPTAPASPPAGRDVPVLTREQLFDLGEPTPPPRGLELAPGSAAAPGVPSDPGPDSNLRDRAHYRHQSDELGVDGPGRPQVGTAEGGIAVPVTSDESVKLKSGVRVDYEKDGTGSLNDAQAAPTVGVEVQF